MVFRKCIIKAVTGKAELSAGSRRVLWLDCKGRLL